MTSFQEKMLAIDCGNRQAAELILAAPHLHGGLGSLEVQWAQAILRTFVGITNSETAESGSQCKPCGHN